MTSVAAAFKEWDCIVRALGAGEQSLVLRKGGIAEGRGGFSVHSNRFWLFPTFFHGQREKTKGRAATWFRDAPVSAQREVEFQYFAELADTRFISDFGLLERLDSAHLWTRETVREKFEWSRPPGVHLLIIRVHALEQPLTVPLTPEMSGCKSWIQVPLGFDAGPSRPVKTDDEFEHTRATILQLLTSA